MSIVSPYIGYMVKLSPYSSFFWKRLGCTHGDSLGCYSFGTSAILRCSAKDPFDDMDVYFDNFDGNMQSMPTISSDIIEAYDTYRVLIELPGMNKDDIDLTLKDRTLNIEGKHSQNEAKSVSVSSVKKSFSLPTNILSNVSKIKAEYKDGVLDVLIPKKNGGCDDNKSSDKQIIVH